jgi:hypothetical protein
MASGALGEQTKGAERLSSNSNLLVFLPTRYANDRYWDISSWAWVTTTSKLYSVCVFNGPEQYIIGITRLERFPFTVFLFFH